MRFSASEYRVNVSDKIRQLVADEMTAKDDPAAARARMRLVLAQLEETLISFCSRTEFSEAEFAERARAELEARQRRAEEARRQAEEERRQAEEERRKDTRIKNRRIGCCFFVLGLCIILILYEIFFASNLFVYGLAFFAGGLCLVLICYYSCSE